MKFRASILNRNITRVRYSIVASQRLASILDYCAYYAYFILLETGVYGFIEKFKRVNMNTGEEILEEKYVRLMIFKINFCSSV